MFVNFNLLNHLKQSPLWTKIWRGSIVDSSIMQDTQIKWRRACWCFTLSSGNQSSKFLLLRKSKEQDGKIWFGPSLLHLKFNHNFSWIMCTCTFRSRDWLTDGRPSEFNGKRIQNWKREEELEGTFLQWHLQRPALLRTPGLVKFVPAAARLFCMALPAPKRPNGGQPWGQLFSLSVVKNQKFASLPPAQGGELLFLLKSINNALLHPWWHYLLVILICLAYYVLHTTLSISVHYRKVPKMHVTFWVREVKFVK